jgi:aminopeptidase N
MDWWNELWLNEGFATWVGWLAVDHFYPGELCSLLADESVMQYLTCKQNGTSGLSLSYGMPEVISILIRPILTFSQAEGVQQAFHLDSLRASHPIEVPVRNALEVDQIFDHISYLKGSSVIRMLSVHLGRETFLRGVADYLKSHAYGSVKEEDFLGTYAE